MGPMTLISRSKYELLESKVALDGSVHVYITLGLTATFHI